MPKYGTSTTEEPGSRGPSFDPFAFAAKHVGLMIGVGALIGALVIGLVYANWRNGVNNEGFEWQRNTVTKYQGVQVELSTCLDNSTLSAQVASSERQSLKDLLIGTASARYQGQNANGTLNAATVTTPVMFNAVHEAYPQVSNELFERLMTTAVGCRNQLAGAMEDLQAFAGRFDIWAHTGNIWVKPVRKNWPNQELEVTGLGGVKITGKAALKFLAEPIITGDAAKAVQSHVMPDRQLFPTATP